MKKRVKVMFTAEVEMEIDQSVLDLCKDPDWPSQFYGLDTPGEVAEHLAYNFTCNNATLSQLDGFAGMANDLVTVLGVSDTYGYEVEWLPSENASDGEAA